ncbi:MAG TPA: serine/threonine-protein kinase [Daejeonella sp.]|nr:serine/threonine-protein kinase [Daejeonella sp.]
MAKIFTITEGLENMGAIRTGGQGSIYKGRRAGGTIVAVKLLPTPILDESETDKNFRDFRNEVEKLKKVNEEPNPNVVKIMNSGITESGSFPFIEMEFIEGPDLEDLLKEPHDPVFTVSEIAKVAQQLANALSHCHKVSVKHGDIKSNNVKFNINTGNYMLLDFGLAIMSDEQRRTSLRHAGAVEFMAPEQNEGSMLFQSDIYSYGIILYELLAGRVPYPLKDSGQTARNTVKLSHMEMPLPDPLLIRKQNLPEAWTQEKKEQEMQVPQWLVDLIRKCLHKNPGDRFSNGMELYEAIRIQSSPLPITHSTGEVKDSVAGNDLQTLLLQERQKGAEKDRQISVWKETLSRKEEEINSLKLAGSNSRNQDRGLVSISRPIYYTLILLIVGLSAYAGYQAITDQKVDSANVSSVQDSTAENNVTEDPQNNESSAKKPGAQTVDQDSMDQAREELDRIQASLDTSTETPTGVVEANENSTPSDNGIGKIFTLAVPQAYFHDKPDPDTRREAFINHWNNARLKALNDLNGFIYVVYTNDEGQVSKGWMNKKDLIIIGE